MKIIGQYFDGQSSQSYEAELELTSADSGQFRLSYVKDAQRKFLSFDFSDLNIESRLGSTPRQINLPNQQQFVTAEHSLVDDLITRFNSSIFSNVIHKLESHFVLVIASVFVTAAFLYGVAVHGIPKAAEIIAHQLPDIEFSESNIDLLDQTMFDPTELDENQQKRILALASPYLDEYEHLNPTLVFRSGVPANAFALPDGHIVFTDEFVQLAEHDEELISVLFHEIGHIHHKHITRRAIQSSTMTILIFLMTGDLDAFEIAAAIPALLMDFSYSRDFEREADRFAIEQMKKNGIDTQYFASMMSKLENYQSAKRDDSEEDLNEDGFTLPEFLSTHPPTQERIDLSKSL